MAVNPPLFRGTGTRTRTSQPQMAVPINAANALTSGLAFVINPAFGFYDSVTPRTVTPNGVTTSTGEQGQVFTASNAAIGASFTGSNFKSSDNGGGGSFSILLIANPLAQAVPEMLYCAASGSSELYFFANYSYTSGVVSGGLTVYTSSGTTPGVNTTNTVDGKMHVYLYVRQVIAGVATGYFYRDGILVASNAVSTSSMWIPATNDTFGGYTSSGYGISKSIALAAAWNRALSLQEAIKITCSLSAPWQLFTPPFLTALPSTLLLPRAPVSPARSRLLGTSTGTVPTVSVLPALTKVRISQPQSAVALSNLAKGDGCTFALGANGYNAATQRLPLFIGTGVSFINSKYGIAVEGTPTAQGIGYSANPGFSEFVPAANSFTVLILVRINSQGTRRFIAGDFIASGNTNQYAIYQTASNQLQVSVGGAFSIFGGVLSTGWHWLENIYDLANSTNTSYIDGVLADANSAPARSTGGTGQFRILSAGEYVAESFDGDIAAFLIFKSVLTKAQRELYKSNPNLAFSRVPVNGWVAP